MQKIILLIIICISIRFPLILSAGISMRSDVSSDVSFVALAKDRAKEGMEHGVDWTWLYKKTFAKSARTLHARKKLLMFEKIGIHPFTQLIVSWNAFRPQKGYFSLYVQVRDAETKKWGIWHHMADWGKDIQQSYMSKSDGYSSYIHVRLELDAKKSADAFKVKIEPEKSASLSLVHGIAVACSDFNLFKIEPSKNKDILLPSIHLSNVPHIAQFALEHEDRTRICSPVSCAMLTHYVTGRTQCPLQFAAGAFDTGLNIYGSWACNMAHAFECGEGNIHFFVRRMNVFADIHQQLMQGIPVVVSVRGNLPGALKSFPHGHLMMVVGWDNEAREVLCHDPAAENHDMVFKRYTFDYFLRAWESSHRLAYIAEPATNK